MRIGVLGTSLSGGGSSIYRVLQPMQDLSKTGILVDMLKPPVSVGSMLGYDVIYLHKPAESQAVQIIETAHELGIKVWIDHDDDIWNVPVDHTAYHVYDDVGLSRRITMMADLVTVSTKGMEKAVKQLGYAGPVIVVENYVPFDDHDKAKEDFIVTWRGGRSHPREIDALAPILSEIGKKDSLWVVGITSSLIPQDRYTFQPLLSPNAYMRFIRTLSPSVFINYWEDIPFNHAKSDIFWREATAVGAAVIHKRGFEVMSDDRYGKECYYLYDDFSEIPKLLNRLKNDKTRRRLVNHSHEVLKDSRDKATAIRYGIMEYLCGKLDDKLRKLRDEALLGGQT